MIIATATSLLFSILLLRFWGALLWLTIGVFTLGIEEAFQSSDRGSERGTARRERERV